MAFKVDKQTSLDIELFSLDKNTPSLYGFYNRAVTIGGQELLYKIISSPFSDYAFLESRKSEINYFFNLNESLDLSKRHLDYIEFYLESKSIPLKNNLVDATLNSLSNKIKPSVDYYTIREGIVQLARVLSELNSFLQSVKMISPPDSLLKNFESAEEFMSIRTISELLTTTPIESRKLGARQINRLDSVFRKTKANELREVLETIYKIDVLQSLDAQYQL